MNFTKYIAALLLSCFALSSHANSEWFKIEVIIFENKDSTPLSAEYWTPITEVPERAARVLKPVDESNIQSYQSLAGGYKNLHQERKLLNGSGKYRVMFHQAWMQPVATTQNPRPIRIKAGDILDNGMYELEGYIGVGRGRYLHFRPDLYFSKRLTKDEEAMLLSHDQVAEELQETASTEPLIETTLTATTESTNSTSSSAMPSFALELPEILTVNLNQARRMRSKEVHYIDHPLFGVVVEITAVE